jgi:hypothetical protein
MDELPENFIDRSFAGGGAKNQGTGYGNGTAFERMKGWGGSGKDWTSGSKAINKKRNPLLFSAENNNSKRLSSMFLLQILKPAMFLICKWDKKWSIKSLVLEK